jgi:hypothetical protein
VGQLKPTDGGKGLTDVVDSVLKQLFLGCGVTSAVGIEHSVDPPTPGSKQVPVVALC